MILKRANKGSAVRSIQEMLTLLGFKVRHTGTGRTVFAALVADGIFGPNTEQVVIDFQRSEGLLHDGVVGPSTMAALEKAYTERVLELNSPGVDFTLLPEDRFTFERVPADPYQEGYDRLSLRNDVATAYRQIYETVHRQGGILTSSGGIRSLDTTVTRSRSVTSFHYLGRALDLYMYSGMVDPFKDPYVVSREAPQQYRVFARCTQDNNPDAELPDEITVPSAISYDDRTRGVEVRDRLVDLTVLFQDHGFHPIKARVRFEEGGSMMGAEWWHFQYQEGLIEGVTSFGQELLKVYTEERLRRTSPWKNRDRLFGINWF
jgi:peptidoglycan hydrolase-like protein with peptidoglycan-binding domain